MTKTVHSAESEIFTIRLLTENGKRFLTPCPKPCSLRAWLGDRDLPPTARACTFLRPHFLVCRHSPFFSLSLPGRLGETVHEAPGVGRLLEKWWRVSGIGPRGSLVIPSQEFLGGQRKTGPCAPLAAGHRGENGDDTDLVPNSLCGFYPTSRRRVLVQLWPCGLLASSWAFAHQGSASDLSGHLLPQVESQNGKTGPCDSFGFEPARERCRAALNPRTAREGPQLGGLTLLEAWSRNPRVGRDELLNPVVLRNSILACT